MAEFPIYYEGEDPYVYIPPSPVEGMRHGSVEIVVGPTASLNESLSISPVFEFKAIFADELNNEYAVGSANNETGETDVKKFFIQPQPDSNGKIFLKPGEQARAIFKIDDMFRTEANNYDPPLLNHDPIPEDITKISKVSMFFFMEWLYIDIIAILFWPDSGESIFWTGFKNCREFA